MTNGDPEGRIFLSYPHTNNGFFCRQLIWILYEALYDRKLSYIPIVEFSNQQGEGLASKICLSQATMQLPA